MVNKITKVMKKRIKKNYKNNLINDSKKFK